MAFRTFFELVIDMARAWGRLGGPLIPPGSNYAQASAISGFSYAFDAFCADVSATQEEIEGMQEVMSWPQPSEPPTGGS